MGCRVHTLFTFARLYMLLQRGCTKYTLSNSKESPYYSTLSLTWKSQTKIFAHLMAMKYYVIVILKSIFMFNSEVEHLALYLFTSGFLMLAYNLSFSIGLIVFY